MIPRHITVIVYSSSWCNLSNFLEIRGSPCSVTIIITQNVTLKGPLIRFRSSKIHLLRSKQGRDRWVLP